MRVKLRALIKQSFNILPFLIVSILFVALCWKLNLDRGPAYLNSTDPEYSLIYNSIVVSTGSFAINFIDHPATPSIFIGGLSSLIIRIGISQGSFVEHFINNSEMYIDGAIFLNLLCIGISLLFAARIILQHFSNFWTLIILSGVLLNPHLIEASSRFIPESTMLIPLLMLMALSIKSITLDANSSREKSLLWKFPFWTAFGVACKLTFAPFILLPFLLIKGKKSRLILLRNTILSLILLAYPLFTNIKESSSWIFNMISHSGKHGTGESNFIDFAEVPSRLFQLLSLDLGFSIILITGIILVIFSLFQSNKNEKEFKYQSLIQAWIICLSLLLVLNLKHFALHYFIPFLSIKMFLLTLIVFYIKLDIKVMSIRLNKVIVLSFLTFSFVYTGVLYSSLSNNLQQLSYQRQEDKKLIQEINIENSAIIIDAPYWGTPFSAYAHAYGFMNSFRRKTYFKKSLQAEFPNVYIYVGWTEKLNHWDTFTSYEDLLNNHESLIVYSANESNLYQIRERINSAMNPNAFTFKKIPLELSNNDVSVFEILKVEK